MKRFIILITTIVLMCILASCSRFTLNPTTEPSQPTTQKSDATSDDTKTQKKEDDELMNKTLSLKIGNTLVDVNWLDNDSVTALKKTSYRCFYYRNAYVWWLRASWFFRHFNYIR